MTIHNVPAENDANDELFDEVLAFVREQQMVSTTLLQRHFHIGYNMASRLIQDLEAHGYIGPSEGGVPRKVHVKPARDD